MSSPQVRVQQIIWLSLACLFAPLLIVSPNRAIAQARDSSANSELLLADEKTVVTASKSVQKVSDVPSAVTVISAEQIAASGATNLLDALRYAAGVDVIDQNGSVANVSIRGFNQQFSNRILVMVDGRSIYEDFFGGVLWHVTPLLISRIKRIEIVRGPGSALYGANAFNGVINIITRTPAEMAAETSRTHLRLFSGERNTQALELQTTAGSPKEWSYSFGAAYNHTDGQGGTSPMRSLFDSYSTPVLTLDAERRMKHSALRFAAGNAEAVTDQVETFPFRDAHGHYSFISLTYVEDKTRNPLLARFFADFSTSGDLGVLLAATQAEDLEIQQTRALSPRHNLVYGGSFRNVNASSNLTKGIPSQQLFALYFQDEWRLARSTSLFTGLRYDHHSVTGSEFSPRLSLVHHLHASQTLRVAYGTAFHAPTITDSFLDTQLQTSPQTALHLTGNKQIKPEHIETFEIGYRKDWKQGFTGASLYYNRITDQIGSVVTAFFPSPPYPPYVPMQTSQANSGSATAFGFELEAERKFSSRFEGIVNYTYQDVQGSREALFSVLIPKHKINVSASYHFSPQWEAFLGAHFVGGIVVNSTASQDYLHPYTRFDTRLGYHFGSKTRPTTLSLIVTNLFNDRHLEYPTSSTMEASRQGRVAYLSLTSGF